jgi:hypothetical protein
MFIKYPKIKILGDRSNEGILTHPGKILITEKVDGANFGFYVKDNILYFCSRNQNLTDSEQIDKTEIPKNWKGIEPVLESWYNDPLKFNPDFYYYGESLQKHTIKYDNIPGFIGYDIMLIPENRFISWELAKKTFNNLNLPFINIYREINTPVEIDYLKSLYQKSAYRDGSAEGIVIKRYDTQQMAKIVDTSFKEKHFDHAGRSFIKLDSSNEQGIVKTYATPARIKKIIHKLHDEGNEIEMPMMKSLFRFVVADILEEEILKIYQNYNSINFKTLNKLVSKKCSVILKQVIINEI